MQQVGMGERAEGPENKVAEIQWYPKGFDLLCIYYVPMSYVLNIILQV